MEMDIRDNIGQLQEQEQLSSRINYEEDVSDCHRDTVNYMVQLKLFFGY